MDTKKIIMQMSMCKSWWKSIYTKIIMKSNYKNKQNKWQENYAIWFIELNKKNDIKKIVFKKFQRIFLKMILN